MGNHKSRVGVNTMEGGGESDDFKLPVGVNVRLFVSVCQPCVSVSAGIDSSCSMTLKGEVV